MKEPIKAFAWQVNEVVDQENNMGLCLPVDIHRLLLNGGCQYQYP